MGVKFPVRDRFLKVIHSVRSVNFVLILSLALNLILIFAFLYRASKLPLISKISSNSQKTDINQQNMGNQKANLAVSVTPDESKWKVYTHPKFQYQFSYPADWNVEESKESADTLLVSNTDKSYGSIVFSHDIVFNPGLTDSNGLDTIGDWKVEIIGGFKSYSITNLNIKDNLYELYVYVIPGKKNNYIFIQFPIRNDSKSISPDSSNVEIARKIARTFRMDAADINLSGYVVPITQEQKDRLITNLKTNTNVPFMYQSFDFADGKNSWLYWGLNKSSWSGSEFLVRGNIFCNIFSSSESCIFSGPNLEEECKQSFGNKSLTEIRNSPGNLAGCCYGLYSKNNWEFSCAIRNNPFDNNSDVNKQTTYDVLKEGGVDCSTEKCGDPYKSDVPMSALH